VSTFGVILPEAGDTIFGYGRYSCIVELNSNGSTNSARYLKWEGYRLAEE
jgi:hypothetical protein